MLKNDFKQQLLSHLPLIAAVIFAIHTHFLMAKATTGLEYLAIGGRVLLVCLPFFIAHHLSYKTTGFVQKTIWFTGFIVYPNISLSNQWSLLNVENTTLCMAASLAWFAKQKLNQIDKTPKRQFFWLTLDSSFMILLSFLALLTATALTTGQATIKPAINAPSFQATLNVDLVLEQLPVFISYLWQCLFIGLLIHSIYLSNRYILIRKILAKHGVLAFVSSALILIITITPLLMTLVLYLPANQSAINSTTPLWISDQPWPFAPVNYQLTFALIALSTPLILLFERQQQQTKLAQAMQQQSATELQLLQQQINPHFLFNTLNNLYAMTLSKSDQAPDLIVKLSNLLRYTIYEGKKQQVPLSQEIAYLQDYIALEHIRCHNKCTINQQWPQNAEQYTIAPLLIIMILENAFKHGVAPAIDKSFINFNISIKDNTLTVICENSVSNTPEKTIETCGIGLENLQRRLSLLYPKSHQLNCGLTGDIWRAALTLTLKSRS